MRVSPPALPAAWAASSAVNCSWRQAAAPLSGLSSLPSMCGAVQEAPILGYMKVLRVSHSALNILISNQSQFLYVVLKIDRIVK